MKKRALTPEESLAWARVAKSIRVLEPVDRDFGEDLAAFEGVPSSQANPAKRTAKPSPALLRGQNPPERKLPDFGPANREREKRIRRGKIEISGRFDLHGHTQATASVALPRFIRQHRSDRSKCLLVITGKGKQGEGILRRNFLEWLKTESARSIVSGYAEAHQRHGGAGAFYVFPRRLR